MKKLVLAAGAALAFAGTAQAADLRPTPIPAEIIAPVSAFSWTGFYIGGTIGGAFSNAQTFGAVPPGSNINGNAAAAFLQTSNNSFSRVGPTGGIHIGGNIQVNNFVFGLEADISAAALHKRSVFQTLVPFNAIVTDSVRTNWLSTGRVRVGIAADRTLFYLTGGVAAADIRFQRQVNFPGDNCALPQSCHFGFATSTRVGWTIGAGIDHALTPNWILRGEYLYANFGSAIAPQFQTLSAVVAGQTLDHGARMRDIHVFRLGLSYLIGNAAAPVAARF